MNILTYIFKRLLLIIPTFLGITVICFAVFQAAPGGPIESYIANMKFAAGSSDSGESGGATRAQATEEVVEELKKKYGFDKPIHERYFIWLGNAVRLDFGHSYTFGKPVTELVASKLPVSVRFGIASFLLSYLICIPLGIMKARRDGSLFDATSSFVIFLMYSIPPYMLGIVLIFLFSGGSFFDWFPLGGIKTLDSEDWTLWEKIKDQTWHMVLPLACFTVTSFARMTVLMKNSMIEQIESDYIRTARAKGLSERMVVWKHALRNSLIPLTTDIGDFIAIFFASNLLIERIFDLDGFGKLFFDAALSRDYPLMMGSVFIGTTLALVARLISDVAYVLVDPRIDFK